MYLDHYGFSEKPFTITPNPRFIFLSKNHREVFAHLLYGIQQHAGFIELTGEVGTGKTTVLRTLFAQLEQDAYRLAFIFNPSLSAPELLHSIAAEFGLDVEGLSGTELLGRINRFLLEENSAGRTVVLVIDEAQNLSPEVLEQIRLLSNLETETDKLIQIVLVGQPELGALLERPALRQLSQRITVRYHLRPMDLEDSQSYIVHRLRIAGARGAIFTPGAMRKIYAFSKGYPRLINVVCDRALLVAYSDEEREIAADHVDTAIRELRREAGTSRFRIPSKRALAASGLVLALALGFLYSAKSVPSPPVPSPARAEAGATPAANAAPGALSPERLQQLQRVLSGMQEEESAALAFNAVADLWGARPVRPGGKIAVPKELQMVVQRRGLELEFYQGSLDGLLRLDHPAILELAVPGVRGWRYTALVSIREGRVLVVPSLAGNDGLSTEDLRQLWSGRAWVVWKNYLRLPTMDAPRGRSREMAQIQELLKSNGMYKGELNGSFDRNTMDAIARFQTSRGIAGDGKLGPQTMMLLYQYSPHFSSPRIGNVPSGGRS